MELSNPHFVTCYTIMFTASQWVDSLECVTPNYYILQSLTAILCHFLSLHNPWHTKICQRNAFSHTTFPFVSVCHPISSLSSGPHFCTPNSARKYWTLNSLWSWWETKMPGTFEDHVRKANNKLSPSKLLLFRHVTWFSFALIDSTFPIPVLRKDYKVNEGRPVAFLL